MSFPAQNYGRYLWRQSPDDKCVWVRHGAGGERYEDFLNRYVHGEQNLFVGVQLLLSKPVEPSTLLAAARNAWTALWYSVPTVSLATTQDAEDNTLMVYHAPQDSAEVANWADRTTFLHAQGVDLDTLRVELGKLTLPFDNGDQTFLNFVPTGDGFASRYGVLLHTDHTPFDGAGTRILMSRFLALLPQSLDDPSGMARHLHALRWGEEAANLLPAYCSVVSESEPLSGPRKFFTFALTDSRSRLAPPYNEDPKGYPGYCLGISGINVPLSLVTGETVPERLQPVANAIKNEYAKDKACPALLGAVAQEIDLVIAATKAGPPPDPWMGPWYAGGGIGEGYLDPAYTNAAEVLRVLDFFTSLNQIM